MTSVQSPDVTDLEKKDVSLSEKDRSLALETNSLHYDGDLNSSVRIESIPEVVNAPWKYKALVLMCICLFPLGKNWADASLGSLKNTLREELGITNTQFAVISSGDSIVNTVLPLVGGMAIDWYGPNWIIITCTTSIFVGSLVGAIGVQMGLWRVLVGGNILLGLGVAVLDTATQKLYYHWFGVSGLAFAFGFENSFSSAADIIGTVTAIPIRDGTGSYVWTFWISVIFCAISLAMGVFYVFMERVLTPQEYRLTPRRVQELNEDRPPRKFRFESLRNLPWAYLMLPCTQLLQSGAAGAFSTSSADIIRSRGFEEDVAGYISSAKQVLPIVLTPLIGIAIDRWGHRFHYVALAPIFHVISLTILGFTTVHPLVALVFSSLAGTINAFPLQIAIPLLVGDQDKIGTAFGVWRAFNNSGSTIMDLVFGRLQDIDGGSYDKVFKFAIGVKSWAFFLGLFYMFIDWRYLGSGVTMTRKQREAREAEIVDRSTDPLTRRTISRRMFIVAMCLLVAMVAAAWTLFLKYLV